MYSECVSILIFVLVIDSNKHDCDCDWDCFNLMARFASLPLCLHVCIYVYMYICITTCWISGMKKYHVHAITVVFSAFYLIFFCYASILIYKYMNLYAIIAYLFISCLCLTAAFDCIMIYFMDFFNGHIFYSGFF